jgi:hypothetical protein
MLCYGLAVSVQLPCLGLREAKREPILLIVTLATSLSGYLILTASLSHAK